MAFKEKIAWATFATMLVAYGVYFAVLASAARDGPPPMMTMLIWFAGVTVAQVIAIAIITAALAILARGDANAPADERDRAIARRAGNIAYYVLMVGMIVVGVVMPFSEPSWKIINAALLSLVIAEATRYILVILSYRRGWHG
jgi:cytochrome b561